MVDQMQSKPFSQNNSDQTQARDAGIMEQARATGRDLKDKAAEIASSSSEAVKSQASEFVDAAKNVASEAGEKIRKTAEEKKSAGVDYVSNIADTIRRASREFDTDLPIAGAYIRKAAAQIEGVSDSIKTGNLNDLVRNTQSFARKQPTAFLGLTVLAGFAAVRFLKSSADKNQTDVTADAARMDQGDLGSRYGQSGVAR